MKTTNVITVAILAAALASPSVAQVAASFDDLVDDVLATIDTSFFSGAVNTSDINASVNITAGTALAAGSISAATSEASNEASNSASNAAFNGAANIASNSSDEVNVPFVGVLESTQADAASLSFAFSGATSEASSSAESAAGSFGLVVNDVTQDFGRISTVAAGAINDSDITLNQTGSLASSAVMSSTSNTMFDGSASNTTGADFAAIQGAFNNGDINASVNLAMANANGGATSIDTVAAGAINAGKISATFIGGNDAQTNVQP